MLYHRLPVTRLAIDVDGSPRAYAFDPKDEYKALDYARNACRNSVRGHFSENVVVFKDGKPYVQETGPHKGMLIAKTSLRLKPSVDNDTDITAYVNPEVYPYFVLQSNGAMGMRLGDIAYVENSDTGQFCFAIFADIGHNTCTEGSLKLVQNLGSGITDGKEQTYYGHFTFILFPQSGYGNYHPISLAEINEKGMRCMFDYVDYKNDPYPPTLFETRFAAEIKARRDPRNRYLSHLNLSWQLRYPNSCILFPPNSF